VHIFAGVSSCLFFSPLLSGLLPSAQTDTLPRHGRTTMASSSDLISPSFSIFFLESSPAKSFRLFSAPFSRQLAISGPAFATSPPRLIVNPSGSIGRSTTPSSFTLGAQTVSVSIAPDVFLSSLVDFFPCFLRSGGTESHFPPERQVVESSVIRQDCPAQSSFPSHLS